MKIASVASNGWSTPGSQVDSLPEQSASLEQRKRAIGELYEAHVERLHKFIFFKVGNKDAAEDITSQVFIKAAKSLDVDQQPRVLVAWLYQVARTTISDYWRQHYKVPTVSLEELQGSASADLFAEPLRSGQGEALDLATEKAMAIVAALPHNYRLVLQLRFLQSYTLKETAQAMSISENNAKALQRRALQKAARIAVAGSITPTAVRS